MSHAPSPSVSARAASRSAVRRIATARLVSLTGTQAATTALLFAVYARTGSTRWVAAALLLSFGATAAVSPMAGALGDRFDRRLVMILSDLAAAVCFFALSRADSPPALLGLAFLASVLEAPFASTASAAVPNLASPEDLGWANGTISIGGSVGYLAGPALGGVVVALGGPSLVFLANALSFLLSAAVVSTVRGSFSSSEEDSSAGRLRAGFVALGADPVLRAITIAFGVFVLSVGAALVADLPLAASFEAGSVGYGMIATSWAAGSLIGSWAGRFLTVATEPKAQWLACAATAVALLAIAAMPAFPPILALSASAGLTDAIADVAAASILQRRTADEVRSRVMAAYSGIMTAGLGASFVLAGPIVAAAGPKVAYVLAGAGCAVTAGVLGGIRSSPPSPVR